MSESEYRDAREAARARVAVLESELRDLDASVAPAREPPPSTFAEEKKHLRDRLGRIGKGRNVFGLIAAWIFLSIARHSLFNGSAAAGIVASVVVAAILLTIFFRKREPRGEELELEKRLREIIKIEDDDYARFRVETSEAGKRVEDEIAQRARIEREIEEARALADENLDREKVDREKAD
jgi:hypothetical protein